VQVEWLIVYPRHCRGYGHPLLLRCGGESRLNRGPNCVGCGYCCTEVICRTGAMFYGHYSNPCPALTWNGLRYVCSLYLSDPERYHQFIAIGDGCCFPLNPRRAEVKNRA
jgi:hypothetical protein